MQWAVTGEGVVDLKIVVFILEFVFVYIIEVERRVRFQYHAHASTVDIVRWNSDLSEVSAGNDKVTVS